MKKEVYSEAELEIVRFEETDIITESPESPKSPVNEDGEGGI